MSIANAQVGVAASRATLRSAANQIYQWQRPAAWLQLPSVAGQQRFVGLHRIDPEANFVALTVAGAYTVDWGDGTTSNHATGTTAYKQYDYTTIPNTGESTLGYRQVIIQVYPQSGQNLTSLTLAVRHNQAGISSYAPGWLDVAVNGSNLTTLAFSSSTVPVPLLEQAAVGDHAVTNMSSMFNSCRSLRSVNLFNTASVTNMTSMFASCTNLQTVPLFNTVSCTNMTSMFGNCNSLQLVPLFNTAAVTLMTGMFSGCVSLQTVPLFNTALVANMANMFLNCQALQTIPLLNTAAVTSFSGTFQNCFSLQTVPALNTAAATNMGSMFSACGSLQTVPALNSAAVSSVTNMNSVFSTCSSLSSAPLNGTRFAISYANCKLSATALNAIFTNLGTAAGSTTADKTITITGNWGSGTANLSIAQAKGWTVAA